MDPRVFLSRWRRLRWLRVCKNPGNRNIFYLTSCTHSNAPFIVHTMREPAHPPGARQAGEKGQSTFLANNAFMLHGHKWDISARHHAARDLTALGVTCDDWLGCARAPRRLPSLYFISLLSYTPRRVSEKVISPRRQFFSGAGGGGTKGGREGSGRSGARPRPNIRSV